MINMEALRNELKKYTVTYISSETGLHVNIIYKVLGGVTDHRVSTINRLQQFVEDHAT